MTLDRGRSLENIIREIFYSNIQLLRQTDKIVYYFRIQNYDAALRTVTEVLNQMDTYILSLLTNKDYFNDGNSIISQEYLIGMLDGFLNAQESKDYILLADLYEIQFAPFVLQLQEIIIHKEETLLEESLYQKNINVIQLHYPELCKNLISFPDLSKLNKEGYEIELTACGLKTLARYDKNIKYYFHSNNQVFREGFELANSWYLSAEEKSEYIIYGYGLGYHVKELSNLDRNIKIEIYESDINIIQLACVYTELTSISNNPNINLIYDPDFSKIFNRIKSLGSDTEFVIHYPSLRNIKNPSIRKSMENYFIQYSSMNNQRRLLNGNFNENILNYDSMMNELRETFSGRDLYIVASGPSLDKNFMQLREIRKNAIILATGTVLKKLINAGITPDYFIVTDANSRVYEQISGFENIQVPMLLLSTAFKDFAKKYQGKKYMICQKDYSKAEKYASLKGDMLFETGGSVSTTALDIGISFGCRRIIFVGLDLAYTDNFVHANDTSQRDLICTEGLWQVEDIYGNMVYTNRTLDIYRGWIEKRIRGVENVEFIDATEGGAKIQGMKIMKLSECIFPCN